MKFTHLVAAVAVRLALALPPDSDNEWKPPGEGDGELSSARLREVVGQD